MPPGRRAVGFLPERRHSEVGDMALVRLHSLRGEATTAADMLSIHEAPTNSNTPVQSARHVVFAGRTGCPGQVRSRVENLKDLVVHGWQISAQQEFVRKLDI